MTISAMLSGFLEDEFKIQYIRGWLGTGAINFFGLPFAGKDTQCEKFAESLEGQMIQGGELLRKNPGLTDDERKIMEAGELLPIEVYLRLVVPILGNPDYASRPLMYASVGRFFGEEGAVLRASKAAGHTLRVAVLIEVSDEDLLRHRDWSREDPARGIRSDDDPEKLALRITEFHDKTDPVINFYRQSGMLIAVSGAGTKEEVYARILDALYNFALNRPRH